MMLLYKFFNLIYSIGILLLWISCLLPGVDFNLLTPAVQFNQTSLYTVISIQIIDDRIRQGVKEFSLALQAQSGTDVRVDGPNSVGIEIASDDGE